MISVSHSIFCSSNRAINGNYGGKYVLMGFGVNLTCPKFLEIPCDVTRQRISHNFGVTWGRLQCQQRPALLPPLSSSFYKTPYKIPTKPLKITHYVIFERAPEWTGKVKSLIQDFRFVVRTSCVKFINIYGRIRNFLIYECPQWFDPHLENNSLSTSNQ